MARSRELSKIFSSDTLVSLDNEIQSKFIAQAIEGQTANLLELRNSSGSVVSSVGPTGALGGSLVPPASGLVHINETTWTSSSSVNINNVFTSTYRFYRLIFDVTQPALGDATIRLRAGGTNNEGTDYNQGFSSLTTANNTVSGASNVATSWNFMKVNNVGNCSAAIDIYNPQVSGQNTMATCNWSGATTVLLGGYSWLFLNNTTSYDGLTISFPSTTGRVKIYGYGG
jgi:hypothetical protein